MFYDKSYENFKNSLLNKYFMAELRELQKDTAITHHQAHDDNHGHVLKCHKYILFYKTYVELDPHKISDLEERTRHQNDCKLWND